MVIIIFFFLKASGCQDSSLPSSASRLEGNVDQNPEIKRKKVLHSVSVAPNKDTGVESGLNVIKSKKGLGLTKKREALSECDVNFKVTKMS